MNSSCRSIGPITVRVQSPHRRLYSLPRHLAFMKLPAILLLHEQQMYAIKIPVYGFDSLSCVTVLYIIDCFVKRKVVLVFF